MPGVDIRGHTERARPLWPRIELMTELLPLKFISMLQERLNRAGVGGSDQLQFHQSSRQYVLVDLETCSTFQSPVQRCVNLTAGPAKAGTFELFSVVLAAASQRMPSVSGHQDRQLDR